MSCGIYSILNKNNGKIYVGQSIHIERRFREHIWKLNTHIHENEHLQNAWEEYGEDSFEFGIIEKCSNSQLNENEIWWIAYFQSTNRKFGYNKESGGNSSYLVSNDTRKKISKSNTSTGIYKVHKWPQKTCRQGFTWLYKYYENGEEKQFTSVSIHKLREKVLSKNLPWIIIDVDKAKETLNSTFTLNGRIKQKNNPSGYYRVGKQKNSECKQGFCWRYSYTENGKRKSLVSVSIPKLRDKVLAKGLEWRVLDNTKVMVGDAE